MSSINNSIRSKRKLIEHEPFTSKRFKESYDYKFMELSDCGQTFLYTGRFEQAEKQFLLALQLHLSKSLCQDPNREMKLSLRAELKSDYRSRNFNFLSSLSTIVNAAQDFTTDRQLNKSVEKEQDYDEGINPNFMPFNWRDVIKSVDDITKASIMIYNVGHTFFWRKNFKEAEKWFGISFASISQTMGDPNIDDKLKILSTTLQYLGVCFYREGKYYDSVKCFKSTLAHLSVQSATNNENVSVSIATTKNALGLSLFHFYTSSTNTNQGVMKTKHLNFGERFEIMKCFEESVLLYSQLQGSYQKDIATVLNNMGRVHYLLAEYTIAMRKYKLALELRRKIYTHDSIDLAVSVCNLGQTYHQLGLLNDAMTLLQEFMGLMKYHSMNNRLTQTDAAIIMTCIATIHYERGDLNESRKMYEKALQTTKSTTSCVSLSQVACILNKLGSVCYKLNELDSAIIYLKEGLNAEMKLYGTKHPNVIVTLLNIAQIHRDRNFFLSALLCYSQIHAIQTEIHGNLSLPVARALYSMGLMWYRMKEYSRAFEKYQAALSIQREVFGDNDNTDVASTLNSIGLTLFHIGKIENAKTYFEESLQIRKNVFGLVHPDVATNLYNLATLHLKLGNDIKAEQMFKETLKVEQMTNGTNSQDIIQTLQHLGLLYQKNGEIHEALKYFKQSLEFEKTRKIQDPLSIGRLLNLIGNIHLQTANTEEMMWYFTEASRTFTKVNSSYRNTRFQSLIIGGFSFYELCKLHPACAEAA